MSQTQSASHQIVATAEAAVCRPWLRYSLDPPAWTAFGHAASREGWVLLALWADTVQVHALLFDPNRVAAVAVSTTVDTGRYGALSPVWPGAAWYERMIHDLWGHVADGAADLRPWLDHGEWPQLRPMAAARAAQPVPPVDPPLAPAADTVVPLGPIWGRIDEAAHLRLSLEGTQIRRAESLLGYCHKGTLTLMRGKSPRAAARFVARLSADATVAHSVAFAHAAENALDVQAPPRAAMLRIVMIELERIAGHLDNLAEVATPSRWAPRAPGCGKSFCVRRKRRSVTA
jgi:Ni,Fe-hydrogenase III component G